MPLQADDRSAGPEILRDAVDRAEVLAEITELAGPLAPVRAEEVTIRMVAEQWECASVTAQRRLDRMVASGELVRRKAVDANGRVCWAYKLSE